MNFYKHHLGDYDGATAHLSWDEDMAYTRLLRAYYRREHPLVDASEACRLVRATSVRQRAAVDVVLGEFFKLGPDGWHNKRADEEIARYREEGEEGEAKKENERERQLRYRERRKQLFEELRGYGIVPKWDMPLEQVQALLATHQQRVQGRDNNAPVTRTDTAVPEPLTRTTNQEPLTKNQEPIKRVERASRLPPTWNLPVEWGEWAMQERPELTTNALQAITNKFRDHWLAQPGQKGVKADWQATWRNWVRNDWGSARGKTSVADDNKQAVRQWISGNSEEKLIEGERLESE